MHKKEGRNHLSSEKLREEVRRLTTQNMSLTEKIKSLEGRCHDLENLLESAEPDILRKSRRRLHEIIDQAPALIAYIDSEERYICCNAAYEQWFGVSPKTIRGKRVSDVVGNEIYLQLTEAIQKSLAGEYQDVEVDYFREKNRGRTIRSRLVPQLENNGRVKGYVELSTDVTDHKDLQNQLKEKDVKHERIKRVLDETSDLVTIAYPDGELIYCNKSADKFLHLGEGNNIEGKIGQIKHPEWAEKIIQERGIPGAVQDGKWRGETAIILEDGGEIPVSQVLISHQNKDGQVEYFSTIIRDISERVDYEKRLRNAMRQISFYNRDLEQLAYSCSHDLAEPLRTISGFLQLLKKRYGDKLDDKGNKFLSQAMEGANRLERLLADLLQYTRITDKRDSFACIDMNTIFEEVLRALQRKINKKQAKIISQELPVVEANESQMILLFQNLISNALKFCRDELPHIEVSAQRKGHEWVFAVRDNGIGIDPQFKSRIFKVFQRLHRRDEYSGSGIGLSICQKIVSSHNGKIWLESEPGKGTTFYFSLPAAERSCAG